jgi:hypothetical protein
MAIADRVAVDRVGDEVRVRPTRRRGPVAAATPVGASITLAPAGTARSEEVHLAMRLAEVEDLRGSPTIRVLRRQR